MRAMETSLSERLSALAGRLANDDSGQDIIEYAFLAAFVGVAGYVVLGTIGPAVATTYGTWISPTTGSPALWDPAAPWVSSGS